MTILLSAQNLSKYYGARRLFEGLSLHISQGDRIGLIGPNGSGKSTLLKILASEEKADAGVIAPRKYLKAGYVPQECEFPKDSVKQVLFDAIEREMPEYEKAHLVEMWLSKLGFKDEFKDEEFLAEKLSGGWKKRLKIAQILIGEPDLILYDEPTNHLDLEGILWLEKFLLRESPAYLLVSHDRYFLQNTTSRVIEISDAYPGGMFTVDGPYLEFLRRKEEFLSAQIRQERSLASKARREADWLRQGAKARTTKAQSRIDEAHEIFEEHAEVSNRNKTKRAKIQFTASERETRKLLSVNNIAKSIGERLLFSHLNFTLSPGNRIGLMGPNGAGKTTLLKLIAGEIEPDQGTIKRADDLKIVYFDQHRAKIPSHSTLREALSPKGDYVDFQGQLIHVNGWCKRFLFSPDILDMPISRLSGGERARISIAHLMLQPADLLLLDEPTNDLDIPTLETLEESLLEFPGAVVLITHDRCMLDRICNSVLALGDPANAKIYQDYLQWEKDQNAPVVKLKEKKETAPVKRPKLSYKDKKEYEEIEGKIEALEKKIAKLNQSLEDPLIAKNADKLSEVCKEIAFLQTQVEQAYLRWEELERNLNR
jgi:ATP-binding cassette subfamily F protein uup